MPARRVAAAAERWRPIRRRRRRRCGRASAAPQGGGRPSSDRHRGGGIPSRSPRVSRRSATVSGLRQRAGIRRLWLRPVSVLRLWSLPGYYGYPDYPATRLRLSVLRLPGFSLGYPYAGYGYPGYPGLRRSLRASGYVVPGAARRTAASDLGRAAERRGLSATALRRHRRRLRRHVPASRLEPGSHEIEIRRRPAAADVRRQRAAGTDGHASRQRR